MDYKLIYIIGLSHVGSTMLDLVLGSHSRYVGLGEIFQVLRPDIDRFNQNAYCSCGKVIEECPFWRHTRDWIVDNNNASLAEKYKYVLEVFKKEYRGERIMIDSSKLLDVLKIIKSLGSINLKVIYLIRDVRAWTISRLNNRAQNENYFSKNGMYVKKLKYQYGKRVDALSWLLPSLTKTPSYYFWIWYLQNKQIRQYLDRHRVSYFQLGYEELGLAPQAMMNKLHHFLGTENEHKNFSSEKSNSHIFVGNVKKTEKRRRQGIFYDYRWMYRFDWLRSAALFPNIMRYNARHVYANLQADSIWEG